MAGPERRGLAESVAAAAAAAVDVVLARASLIGLPSGASRALEYRCGIGALTAALADHFDEVVGIDPSEQRIDSARLMFRDRPGCTFVVGGLSAIAELPGRFGLALADIGHPTRGEGPDAVAEALLAALVPGGVAALRLAARSAAGVTEKVDAAGGHVAWSDEEDDAVWLFAVAGPGPLRLLAEPGMSDEGKSKRAMA